MILFEVRICVAVVVQAGVDGLEFVFELHDLFDLDSGCTEEAGSREKHSAWHLAKPRGAYEEVETRTA